MDYRLDRNHDSYMADCTDQVLAMAYVPVQQLDTVYEPEAGFSRGTIFPELDKPFVMAGGCCAHG